MKKKIFLVLTAMLVLGANALIIPNIFAEKAPQNIEISDEKGNKLIYNPLFDVDNISYSRNFYKSEIERRGKLNYEYSYNKAMPSKTMDERAKEDGLYFDREKNMVVLPERELTDEEILALCDFYANINTLFEKNRPHPTEDMITKEDAEKIAEEEVKAFYSAELKNFNMDCAYNGDIGREEGSCAYTVCFSPINEPYLAEEKKPYYVYFVDIDAYTGKTLSVDSYYSRKKSEWKKAANLSEKEKKEFAEKSKAAMKGIADIGSLDKLYISKFGNSVVTCFDNGAYKYNVELSYPNMDKVGWEKVS